MYLKSVQVAMTSIAVHIHIHALVYSTYLFMCAVHGFVFVCVCVCVCVCSLYAIECSLVMYMYNIQSKCVLFESVLCRFSPDSHVNVSLDHICTCRSLSKQHLI